MRNKAGQLGAWVSDLALFLFGYSVWWLPLVGCAPGCRRWRAGCAATRHRREPHAACRALAVLGAAWLLLMAASCALEWTRLYRCEALLPGPCAAACWAIALGPPSMKWLGFAGSGVLWIAALVVGVSMALRFSWLRSWPSASAPASTRCASAAQKRSEQCRRPAHRRAGAASSASEVVEVERQEIEDHVPIVIEPPVVEVPKSERVAKERQKPLFIELPDTKLPQVDLLDARAGAHGDRDARDRWR